MQIQDVRCLATLKSASTYLLQEGETDIICCSQILSDYLHFSNDKQSVHWSMLGLAS